MTKQNIPCLPCGIRTFCRNTYFNGKLLVERDFKDEQAYIVGKDRLHNNLLHGMGTVCGLKVKAHPNPECRDRYVCLEPGMAVDCCGREIIVPGPEEEVLIPILDLIDQQGVQVDETGSNDLFISLCLDESLEEKIPVILPDCECADADQAYNRICEGYRIHLFSKDAGVREEERQPLRASLDWLHTITLAGQSPRALAVDDEMQQLYVAAQALPGEGEEAGELGARLYAFRTDTHDLITSVDAGLNPTDLALSLLGNLIFLAAGGLGEEQSVTGIAVFREADIRSQSEPAAIIDLGEPARLMVSPHTGALFALLLDTGTLHAWSEQDIRDWLSEPSPSTSGPEDRHELALGSSFNNPDGPALRGAAMRDVTLDGRYLFVVDSQNPEPGKRLRVIDVARLFSDDPSEVTPSIDPDGIPLAVATSRDSEYVYVLWQSEGDDSGHALLTRYALDTSSGSFQLRRDGRGGEWPAVPHDLALAPDERWAYVLESDDTQGQVQTISIDKIAIEGDEPVDARGDSREKISGDVRYERLAVMGGRLYVAANDEATDVQPERGLVAILDVEEAACDDLFTSILDECPSCRDDDANSAGNCVVLASIPQYRYKAMIEDPGNASEDDNEIDNLTHRPLLPSTTNITEVIRCMLEQGIAEGVPGPRGAAGKQGPEGPRGSSITDVNVNTLPAGSDATANLEPIPDDPEGDQRLLLGIPAGLNGQDGSRGPGVTDVNVNTLPAGSDATANLEPIPDDPEGDQRLLLGIPAGLNGQDGSRGPGITDVDVNTLPAGSYATADLEPIPGDPEGDQRLRLGIPRGDKGDPGPINDPDLTHILRLSWIHGAESFDNLDDFLKFPEEPGLVIQFDGEVFVKTILNVVEFDTPRSEVFQLYARYLSKFGECECIVPGVRCEPVKVQIVDGDRRIVKVEKLPLNTEMANAVRLVLEKDLPSSIEETIRETGSGVFRVVFRADFALNTDKKAVDGNHIGGLPSGNGRQGGTFESWFTVTTKQV